MVNTDKYKNFKSVDEEKQKFDERVNFLQEQLDDVQKHLNEERNSKDELSRELQDLRTNNQKLQENESNQTLLLNTIRQQNEKQSQQLLKAEDLQK